MVFGLVSAVVANGVPNFERDIVFAITRFLVTDFPKDSTATFANAKRYEIFCEGVLI